MTDRHEDPRSDQLRSWTAEDLLEALYELEQADNTIGSYKAGPPPLT